MTKLDLKIDNLVDKLVERGVSVANVGAALNEAGIAAGPKLLATIAAKLEERRLEEEAGRRSAETTHLKSRMDSVYQDRLFDRQARDQPQEESTELYRSASWRQFAPAFGNDLSFTLKLAQRTLSPPFPRSFVRFVADLRGKSYQTVLEYLTGHSLQMAAEHSSKRKPSGATKEDFVEAVNRSSVPEHLKSEWLGDDELERTSGSE